jgi:hypothetical protein
MIFHLHRLFCSAPLITSLIPPITEEGREGGRKGGREGRRKQGEEIKDKTLDFD